jgi:hypothetical protein
VLCCAGMLTVCIRAPCGTDICNHSRAVTQQALEREPELSVWPVLFCVCVQSLAAVKQAGVAAASATPLTPVDLSAPHTAATAAALKAVSAAHHADSSSGSSSSGADVPVVLATCSASDLAPHNLIAPWSEAVAAAGVPRVLLVSDDAGCAAAAKAAGIKVLQHNFQVSEGGLCASPVSNNRQQHITARPV